MIVPEQGVVIRVRSLKKYFELSKGFLSFGKENLVVKAVDDVNFDIRSGEILGLVGESGCGKTTTGRLLTRLEDPTEGYVFFLGRDIALLEGDDVKVFRRNIQMVFQDPYESLNPRTTVLQTVMEPLVNHRIGDTLEDRTKLVVQALEDSGLAPAKEYLNRFPHELSGGQRQRVSVARALVIKPKVIVADEPVSMLDVSIRAGVLNLMLDLRDKYGIPYLFITHDIAVARYVSDRLGVMYLGRVVELAETEAVIFEPKHPYTQALLSAVPVPDPQAKHGRIQIKGEIPSATDIPLGCRFRPRCPRAFKDCGWQGKDFVEWLQGEMSESPNGALGKNIEKLRPDGFVLEAELKAGGSAEEVISYLKSVAAQRKDEPIFQAMQVIDSARKDTVLEISCGTAALSPEELASEFHSHLVSIIRYKDPDHPMHGVVTDISLAGTKITVKVSPGEGNMENVEAFLSDYVRYYKKRTRPELKGVRSISPDQAKKTVTITCGKSKEPANKVARDVADAISKNFVRSNPGGLGVALLPVKVKKKKVLLRVSGPDSNWTNLESSIKAFLEKEAAAGVKCAKAVSGVSVRKGSESAATVAVRFVTIQEPPLFDVGNGHQVACYLYGPVVK